MVEENKDLGFKDLFNEGDKGYFAGVNDTGKTNPHKISNIDKWQQWDQGYKQGVEEREDMAKIKWPPYMRNKRNED